MSKNYQSHAVFDRNIYWKMNGEDFKLGNLSWKKWQKRDQHSQIVDPLFIDPQAGNFEIQSNSVAKRRNIGRNSF